jgi:hypothetical protein
MVIHLNWVFILNFNEKGLDPFNHTPICSTIDLNNKISQSLSSKTVLKYPLLVHKGAQTFSILKESLEIKAKKQNLCHFLKKVRFRLANLIRIIGSLVKLSIQPIKIFVWFI